MTLQLIPVTLREANAFVKLYHRHHPGARGCRFTLGVELAGALVGVAIVGRPKSRHLDDGKTAEVTRLCTTGARNACSLLYAACWRAARAIGYQRLITYILATEPGISLRAAGWERTHDTKAKVRWEVRA